MRGVDVQSFNADDFVKKHKKSSTSHRLKLIRALSKKSWFQATDADLQDELVTLPQRGKSNHDGFLEALIRRKEEFGGIRVLRLLSLGRGNYTLCPMFEIQSVETGEIYTYDYAAYRHGVPAGAKGLVLIRSDKESEPTHMVLLSGDKFATGENTYDLLGGLPEVDVDERRDIIKGILREIREETGVKNLEVSEIKLLGNLVVDPGHTSHESQLFIAYLDKKDATEITTHAKNLDDFELTTYVHVLHLSEMKNIVRKTSNGMLLAAFAKALAEGIIPMKYCTGAIEEELK